MISFELPAERYGWRLWRAHQRPDGYILVPPMRTALGLNDDGVVPEFGKKDRSREGGRRESEKHYAAESSWYLAKCVAAHYPPGKSCICGVHWLRDLGSLLAGLDVRGLGYRGPRDLKVISYGMGFGATAPDIIDRDRWNGETPTRSAGYQILGLLTPDGAPFNAGLRARYRVPVIPGELTTEAGRRLLDEVGHAPKETA